MLSHIPRLSNTNAKILLYRTGKNNPNMNLKSYPHQAQSFVNMDGPRLFVNVENGLVIRDTS